MFLATAQFSVRIKIFFVSENLVVATVVHSIHADKKQYHKIKGTMGKGQPDVRANKTGCVVVKLSLAFSVLIQFP